MKTLSEFIAAIDMDGIASAISKYYDLNYKIALFLNDYRLNNDLTQTEMGKLIGVKQPMIAKYESGDYNFTLQTLCDVFSKLNVDIDVTIETSPRPPASIPPSDEDGATNSDAYKSYSKKVVNAA